jgi:hypothetical protein
MKKISKMLMIFFLFSRGESINFFGKRNNVAKFALFTSPLISYKLFSHQKICFRDTETYNKEKIKNEEERKVLQFMYNFLEM